MSLVLTRRELLGGGTALALGALLERSVGAAAPRLPFPELEAAGSPGELGLQHGRRFAVMIGRNLAFYRRYLATETRADPERLRGLASLFAKPIAAHAPEQLEEIDGIAKGAKQTRDAILLLNARTDLLVLGRQPFRKDSPPGCTALALGGTVGARPALALGQNWDWDRALLRGTVVLRLRPTGGPRLVTFTEAGMLGKIGMNEHRLGVCLNFLGHKSDPQASGPGLPVHCLLRAALGCKTLEEAYKLIAWAPRSASANILLAQHHGKLGPSAIDLELTPDASARLTLEAETLVHTNHFLHPALAPGCLAAGGRSTTNRLTTAQELARRLRQEEPDPAARMRKVLALRSGAPLSVSKTRAPTSESETLAGIVMDLSRNQLWLAPGPPHAHRFVLRPGA
jgi:isopenicillin-N N-acyltransferase-like protein